MKRKIAIALTLLSILVLVLTLASCGSSKSTSTKSQTYTVTRGNISVDITASGNLAFSTVQDLTFQQFYAEGTVSSVNVSVGDTVTKGEVLASLDQSEWDDQIQALQDALTTAQTTVTTKQRAIDTAQRAVVTQTRTVATKLEAIATDQRAVTSAQYALQQAQLDVTTANNTLNRISAVKRIQDRIDNDNFVIKYATLEAQLGQPVNWATWNTLIINAQADLAQAQSDLAALLSGTSTSTSTNTAATLTSADVAAQVVQAYITIQVKQVALTAAQVAVGDAQAAVDDANTACLNAQTDLTYVEQDVASAQSNLDNAEKTMAKAQKTLDDAEAASPLITAPFDGIVTKVNNAGGDQVYSGAVIVQIADPNKFEASILVSEIDISEVKVGGDATVSLDALTGVNIPAKVTEISPTATISSGVVNYAVVVELQSTTAATNNSTAGSSSVQPAAATSNVEIREGMTATVSLIVEQATNVLLVPYTAISTENGQSYVQVVTAAGTLEKRAIKTGITDYTNTEVTSGLTEGEKINLAKTTTTSTKTSTATATQSNSIMIPGVSGGGSPPAGGPGGQ